MILHCCVLTLSDMLLLRGTLPRPFAKVTAYRLQLCGLSQVHIFRCSQVGWLNEFTSCSSHDVGLVAVVAQIISLSRYRPVSTSDRRTPSRSRTAAVRPGRPFRARSESSFSRSHLAAPRGPSRYRRTCPRCSADTQDR